MDYVTLVAELKTDPLTRGYASMSDDAAADDLNSAYRSRNIDVPLTAFVGYVELHSVYEKIDAANNDANTPAQLKALCAKAIRLRLQNGIQVFEFSDPVKRATLVGMLNALVAGNVIAQADADGIVALSVEPVSRADELGIGAVEPYMVYQARKMIAAGA